MKKSEYVKLREMVNNLQTQYEQVLVIYHVKKIGSKRGGMGASIGDGDVQNVYWDFDSAEQAVETFFKGKMKMNRIWSGKDSLICPTAEDIENLKVGSLAPNVYGEGEVTRIFGRGKDMNGRLYVCYYTKLGGSSQISSSLTEGKVFRNLATTSKYTSQELVGFDV